MSRSTDAPLYPDEAEIARRVLGERAQEWPGKAAVLERDGLPKIDPLMGGRFWPAVRQWFLDRHGLMGQLLGGETLPAKSRVRGVPFAPDGEVDFDGEKAQAARCQRRHRRTGRAGLNVFERRGRVELYWKPNAEARKRGYVPRSVRLHFDLSTATGRLELEHRCRVLTAEMLAWFGDPEGDKRLVYDGTVGALINCYQTDKTSPHRGLRQSTARVYGDWCWTLDRAIGKRRVDRLTGQDLRDCFLRLMEPATPGGAPRVHLAKSCVREMLSILLRYGAELGLPGCLELHQVLGRMMLTVPQDVRRAWKAARPKKSGMRYEHAAAIVAEGIKRGTRRHRAVALGVAAQFELTMRQADVIGVWERIGQTEAVEPGAIVESGRIWRPGRGSRISRPDSSTLRR